MREGGGWSPKSLARKITRDVRHVTPPKPQDRRESALSAVVGRQSTTERRECHSAPCTATVSPPLLRPRPGRQGRSRQGWLIWAEKGLEMRPVGAPHGVALRHFIRNKGLAAGWCP